MARDTGRTRRGAILLATSVALFATPAIAQSQGPPPAPALPPAVLGDSAHWAMWHRYRDEAFPLAATGRIENIHWLDDGAGLWFEREVDGRTYLVIVDAATGETDTFNDMEVTRSELLARSGEADTADLGPGVPSPDGSMSAFIRDDNVWVRWDDDGREVQLTSDGDEFVAYDVADGWSRTWARWSPDSRHLVLMRTDRTSVPTRPSVDWLAPQPTVEWVVDYPWSTQARQTLFTWDAGAERLQPLDVDLTGVDAHWTAFFGWTPDGSELLVGKQYPGEKRVEVVGVDPASGAVRAIFEEAGDVPMEADALDLTVLDDGFLWASERDGMRRLYRYDAGGQILGPITPETVRAGWVEGVDAEEGWVYFMAHANPSRPYDEHFCRVRLDGSGFQIVASEPGVRRVQLSPDLKTFLDVHSSPTRPWRTDLKRSDGTLIRTLAESDLDGLRAEFGWRDAEEFVVKAADGETDLWGVVHVPWDFDPTKSYPVAMWVYTGIWASYAPSFGAAGRAMAQMGFVSVTMSFRGEGGARDRAFRTAFYGRAGCCEHDDAAAVLKQLAADRPWMDMSRVGVAGGSQGGYNAARFILMRPDVFHVAVAERARMFPGYNMVPFLGTPEDNPEGWAQASNLPLANRLQGELLLIQPSNDHFFHSTMKMAEALMRAGKDFDMLIFPGVDHWYARAGEWGRIADEYVWDWKIMAYLVEHLQPEER